jgi:hypothetical protein
MTGPPPHISLAFVHHANQFVVTDGYDNRIGISAIVGNPDAGVGLRRVLSLHEKHRVPLNLHISGTLLESLAWNCPSLIDDVRQMVGAGLIEIIGSSYGQNMMRFFTEQHNLLQLNEELLLYEELLGIDPRRIRSFWVPERLWETRVLAPVIANPKLPNGGYEHVILDDRLLHPAAGEQSPRHLFDYEQPWDPLNFQRYRIQGGDGLHVLPIATNLRQNIPPISDESRARLQAQLLWLADANAEFANGLIAIYADDMEKAGGVGWDPQGPPHFDEFLQWVADNPWIEPVKLTDWARSQPPAPERAIDVGAYLELVNEFEAGESFEKWFFDPHWKPYRDLYAWSERRVRELENRGAEPGLMELAWKILLATAWQTAWHTPRSGAHGEPTSDGGPAAWAKAIASHSRLAAIVAEAAWWMSHKDGLAHASIHDVDHNGEAELVLRNDHLFAVFSTVHGGRLVYLFGVNSAPGHLAVGNPIDDWNLLEALHEFMRTPPNHPGGLSDVGHEDDVYEVEIEQASGHEVRLRMSNVSSASPLHGVVKSVALDSSENRLQVSYLLPEHVDSVSTEIGLSPDYLGLLREGPRRVSEYSPTAAVRGWTNGEVRAWVETSNGTCAFDAPRTPSFGHGYFVRVTGHDEFTLWIGTARAAPALPG